MPRSVLLLTLIAALALGGCTDDTPDIVALSEPEACKAVKEKLDLDALETRFGEPNSTGDFFDDRILTYEAEEGVKWQFQVSARTGTYRALRVEGSREKILNCTGV